MVRVRQRQADPEATEEGTFEKTAYTGETAKDSLVTGRDQLSLEC